MKNKLLAIVSCAVMILMINSVVLGADGDLTVNGDLTVKGNLNFLPAGTMMMYGGSVAPTGWLIADGSAISRTTYANLFAAIGSTFGAGDGSTTFNLPDLRRRVAVGSGGSASSVLGNTVGSMGGEESHILTVNEMPSHTHTYATIGGSGYIFRATSGYGGVIKNTEATGGNTPHNIMQPSLVVNYIIKQ